MSIPYLCDRCFHGAHDECRGQIPTGRTVPVWSMSGRTQMRPEFVACTCPDCREDAA